MEILKNIFKGGRLWGAGLLRGRKLLGTFSEGIESAIETLDKNHSG
ncbi:MAG: hypothetical protein E7J94_24445 [Clostridium sp.]|nr:hypothetical protein [Clostridium sp.]